MRAKKRWRSTHEPSARRNDGERRHLARALRPVFRLARARRGGSASRHPAARQGDGIRFPERPGAQSRAGAGGRERGARRRPGGRHFPRCDRRPRAHFPARRRSRADLAQVRGRGQPELFRAARSRPRHDRRAGRDAPGKRGRGPQLARAEPLGRRRAGGDGRRAGRLAAARLATGRRFRAGLRRIGPRLGNRAHRKRRQVQAGSAQTAARDLSKHLRGRFQAGVRPRDRVARQLGFCRGRRALLLQEQSGHRRNTSERPAGSGPSRKWPHSC